MRIDAMADKGNNVFFRWKTGKYHQFNGTVVRVVDGQVED